jgi:uncharacterized protein (TIGR02145 family)
MERISPVILLLIVIFSCEDLEHANPTDPLFQLTAPDNLKMEVISDSELKLNWSDNSEHESGFRIERDAGSGFSEIGTVSAEITEYTDTGLTYGQSYNYRVAAYTPSNTSSWVTITASTEFPAPSDLTARRISDSEMQLTWTDNTGYETGFKIVRDGGSGFIEIGMISANVTEYTDSGLIYGESYDYRVAAYTASNTSDYSGIATANTTTPLVDWDGNTYGTVKIGNQVWMAENLKVTHYRDGTIIPSGLSDEDWMNLSSGAFTVYENTGNNAETYGALYNWYTANGNAGAGKELAPEGWHIPSDEEWTVLTNYLGNSSVAGGMLKEPGTTHWTFPNAGAINETDFMALPGGKRHPNGSYLELGNRCYFWLAGEIDVQSSWHRILTYDYANIFRTTDDKRFGFSVRCVRD